VSTVAGLNAQGLRCKVQARYDEGRAHYERALALLAEDASPDWEALATLWHNLAGIEHARGDYAAAEALARRGLAIRADPWAADPQALASDLAALAAILDGTGACEEAEALHLEALEKLARVPAAGADIALAIGNVGAHFARRGYYGAAVDLLRCATALQRETLGPDSPDVGITLNNLGVARARQGHFASAAAAYVEAIAILERSLGDGHPQVLAGRWNLERCLSACRSGS
jgi:tetratricopeptide (TPR) repeat protein